MTDFDSRYIKSAACPGAPLNPVFFFYLLEYDRYSIHDRFHWSFILQSCFFLSDVAVTMSK